MTEHDKLQAEATAVGHLDTVDGRLIVAQAETGSQEQGADGQGSAPTEAATPPAGAPSTITVALEAGNIARLPANASIDTPRVNGADIEFVQPDGSVIVIPNGAVQGLTLFVGNTQIPPQTVAALFDANDIQAAAGPGGAGGGNGSSGGNFAVPIGNIGRALDFGDLLPPTALLRGTNNERPLYEGLIIDEPEAGANDVLRLDDDDLGGNANNLGDDPSDPLSGTLNHDYGLNGTGSLLLTGATFPPGLGFAAVVGNGGLELLITQNGKDVMRITLDDSTSGNYTVEQLGPVSHPVSGPSEDNVLFDIGYRVTDQDGDTADGVLTVDVDDDIPVAENTIPGSYDGEFYPADQLDDEGATANNPGLSGNPDGDGDADGDSNTTYGFLTFSPGADGLRDVDFASLHNTTAGFKAIYLLGQGPETGQEAVTFNWDGATHTLTAIGVVSTKTVFSLVIDNVSTGHFELVMNSALVHTSSTGPDNGETDDLSFDLPFTVTDGDGDTATANLTISVDDDSPTITLAEKSAFSLVHDETRWRQNDADDVGVPNDWQTLRDILVTFQSVQNRGIDPHALNIPFIGRLPLGYAESNTAALTIASEGYGADGAAASGARVFSLTLTDLAGNPATEGVNSGLETTEGKTIYLFLESGYVVGRYDGSDGDDEVGGNDPAAFAIRIGDDGMVGVLQYVSLRHFTNPDADDEVDLSDMAGHLKATLTLTDGDGDKTSASVDISGSIGFQDDGPSLDDVSLAGRFGLLIDESADNQTGTDDVTGPLAVFANIDQKGIDPDASGPLGFATESRSPISYDAYYGVDGPGATPVSYALSVANASSGLKLTDGSAINLVAETDGTNNWIVGRVSGGAFHGKAAFAIAIDPASGHVSLVQYLSLQHVAGNPDDVISLAVGSLTATVTITDGDGDSASRTLDISGRISFRDDGPTLNGTATLSATVDEDGLHIPGNLSEGNEDGAPLRPGEENGGGLNTITSAVGALKSLVNFGVDGFGSFSVKTTAPINTAFKSMGETVVVAGSGTTLHGYMESGANSGYQDGVDRLVFTLTIALDGTYTFTLNDQIDHPTLNSQTGDNGENLLGTKIDLSGYVQATDGDGDSITLGAGKFTVDVRDDIPVVTAKAVETVTETITYTLEAGNELYRPVQGKDDYDLLLTGRIGNQATSVNTSGDIGVGTGQAIDQGTPPDTLRIDMVRNLTASGNVNSGSYSADAHYGVPAFTFTVPQVKPIPQAPDVATLFIQIFAVPSGEDNQSGTANFFDNAAIGITSIVAAGATITPVYSGSTIIGYVVSDVAAGTVITVNGASDFGRLEVTNYAGVTFTSSSVGAQTTLTGTDSFSLGGLSTGVKVTKPFEVVHDESPQVNNTSDPNNADDTAAGLPGDLSARLAVLGLTEMGHARATGSVSTLFEASVGADEAGSRSYGFATAGGASFDGVDSGLKTTDGNEAIKLYADPTNGSILWGVTGASFAGGAKVFAAYIDELGQVWLVQFEAIAHNIDGATSAAHDDAISVLADIRVVLSLTDADGDTVSAWSNTPLKLTFQDDGPKAYDNADAVAEGLGNTADGNVLTDATADVLGTDGGAVTGARTGTEGGNGALTAVNAVGVTISGTYGDLLIKADGSYVYTLKTPSIPTNVTSETFTYQVTDGDGDTDLAQLVIALNQDRRIPTLSSDTGTVYEDGLPAGSQAVTDREIDITGKFTVNADGEAFTLTVGGVDFTSAQLLNPATFPSANIDTTEGLLKLTGYNGTTGEVSYTYTLKAALTHAGQGVGTNLTDTIAISVVDATGDANAVAASIVIDIVDDLPTVSILADTTVGDATDASDTVAEDGANLTGAITLVEGADQDATLAITLESGATLSAPLSIALDGAVHSETRTVTGAGGNVLGTLQVAVNADGTASWTFDPSLNVNGTPSFTFKATITDKDGDVADDSHTIAITDGAGPTASDPIALTLDDQNLADGSSAGTDDFTSSSITFTPGSDAINSIAFSQDLSALVGSLSWERVSDVQIVGKDGSNTVVTLDLTTVGNVATIKATLNDNYAHHPDKTADDLQALGSVGVVASDIDGTKATGIVNVGVSDDRPYVTGPAYVVKLSEANLATSVQSDHGGLGFEFGADGPSKLEFARDENSVLIKPTGYSSGGVDLDYFTRPSNVGTGEDLVAFKTGDDPNDPGFRPVFVVTVHTQVDPQYTFTLFQPVDHTGLGADVKTLSFNVVATDGDGDTLPRTIGVEITDGIPFVSIHPDATAGEITDTADTVVEGGDALTGVITLVEGADQDATLTITLGNATLSGALSVVLDGPKDETRTVTAGSDVLGTLNIKVNADGTASWRFVPAGEVNNSAGNPSFTFTATVTDKDNDVASDTHTITITDGLQPNVSAPVTLELDEAALNTSGAVGSDPDLTTEVDSTPRLTFTAGSDALVAFAFDGIANLVSDLDGIGGQDIFWVNGSQQINGYLDAAHTVLAITLDLSAPPSIAVGATGDVTVTATLSDNLKHILGNGAQALSIGSVGVVATSSDNDTKTGVVNITVKDDVPTASAGVDLLVAETAGDTAGVGLLANDTLGADGATVTAVSFDGGTSWVSVPASGTVAQVVAGVGTFTFAASGAWSLDPVVNASSANQSGSFRYRITDGDGDPSEASQAYTVTNVNTPPSVGPAPTIRVSEEGLANGNPDSAGTSDTTNATSASGTLGAADAEGDALTYTFTSAPAGLASGGVALTWSATGTNTLVGSAAGKPVITLTVDSAGLVTAVLSGPIDHANAGGENERSFSVDLSVSDGTVATATSATIIVEDDAPDAFAAEAMTIENGAFAIGSGALNFYESIGADGGSVVFTGTNNALLQTTGLVTVKSGGQDVHLFGFGTGVLTGKIGADAAGVGGTTVFTITLNPSATNEQNDTYKVQFFKALDDGSQVVLDATDLGITSKGGNSPFAMVEGSGDHDVLLSAAQRTGISTLTASTVNASSTTVGIGAAQSVNDNDILRFDFADTISINKSGSDFTYNYAQHFQVNAFTFNVQNTSGTVEVWLRAYAAANNDPPGTDGAAETAHKAALLGSAAGTSQVQVTGITVNGVAIDLNTLQSADGGKSYLLPGLTASDVVTVIASGGMSRIEIENPSAGLSSFTGGAGALDNDSFKAGAFGWGVYTAGVGSPLNLSFAVTATDADGDTALGTLAVTTTPPSSTLAPVAPSQLLVAGNGGETLNGGAGDDTLVGGIGADVLNGGGHATLGDTASYRDSGAAVTASLTSGSGTTGDAAGDTYSGIENLTGSAHNDVLTGDGSANTLIGLAGSDILSGGAGNDILTGGDSNDILIGGLGMDTLTGGTGADEFVFDNFDLADVIADYEAGDKVDLTALFTDLTPGDVSEYVQYNSATGVLQVDADGAGAGSTFETIATVNVSGGGHPTTITILFDDGTVTPHQTDI